ncbi:hypothetical protein D9M68_778310 [compost metagenome]
MGASGKWAVVSTSISSVGWPAFSNIRTDSIVGVMMSFAVWNRSSGRGAILETTSSARKLYIDQAVSTGISMIAFGERFFRSGSGIGTASKRDIQRLSPVSCLCLRPFSRMPMNFSQDSGVGCWPRNLRSPLPQPQEERQQAKRSSMPAV